VDTETVGERDWEEDPETVVDWEGDLVREGEAVKLGVGEKERRVEGVRGLEVGMGEVEMEVVNDRVMEEEVLVVASLVVNGEREEVMDAEGHLEILGEAL